MKLIRKTRLYDVGAFFSEEVSCSSQAYGRDKGSGLIPNITEVYPYWF